MTGVVLLNLGGPETLDDVRPFLRNLFADPDVIRLPAGALWQWAFARLVAWRREQTVRDFYARIGGGSPIRRLTERQASALQAALADLDGGARVYVAMRCSPPRARVCLAAALRDGCSRLIALPLFPQYSRTTTLSSMKELRAELARAARLAGRPAPELLEVEAYPDFVPYLDALTATVRDALAAIPETDRPCARVLFSAHGLPQSYIDDGDPYLEHVRRTVRGVIARLGHEAGDPRSSTTGGLLSFQSKVGRARWLEPRTDDEIERLGREGVRDVVVVPVSFVSDHIETLYEIDLLFGDGARKAGVRLHRARALNDDPAFIGALAALVRARLGTDGDRSPAAMEARA